LWSAEFTIWQAQTFSKKGDVYNTVGCFTRAVENIISALFAINEIYPTGDKRALDILEVSEIKLVNLRNKINNILYGNNRGLVENLSLLKNSLVKRLCLQMRLINPAINSNRKARILQLYSNGYNSSDFCECWLSDCLKYRKLKNEKAASDELATSQMPVLPPKLSA